MKILNLYAGIGGNRKLWGDEHEVTALEINPKIAAIYKKNFPIDNVIVADAHEYLLKHYKEFDFIWASPPCPTHSDIRRCVVHSGQNEAVYPEMSLYQEIILLKHFAKCKWVVENVTPYYKPLIEPQKVSRHCFWSNFIINHKTIKSPPIDRGFLGSKPAFGFDISKEDVENKRKVLRNMVNPELGLHIFELAFTKKQTTLFGDQNG